MAQILSTLGVNGARYEEIMTLAYGTDEAQWVAITLPERRQQMAAFLDWEQNASRIVEVAPLLVPGLLQTGDYVRAIMTSAGVPAGEIASRVTTRLGRGEVITKPRPAKLLVLLGRSALNQDIGGRRVMIEQLRHLLEMAARPNIELRVVPDQCNWHPGMDGAFTLIESKSGYGWEERIDEGYGIRRRVVVRTTRTAFRCGTPLTTCATRRTRAGRRCGWMFRRWCGPSGRARFRAPPVPAPTARSRPVPRCFRTGSW